MSTHPTIRRLDFDPTSTAVDNFIPEEIHTITNVTETVIVPIQGAYYTDTLMVRKNGILLNRGGDWIAAQHSHVLARAVKKEGSYLIRLKIAVTAGDIITLTYNAVGGNYRNISGVLADIYNSIGESTVNADDILNLPDFFDPKPHQHSALEVYGTEDIVEALNQLKQATLLSNMPAYENMLIHMTTLGGGGSSNKGSKVYNDIASQFITTGELSYENDNWIAMRLRYLNTSLGIDNTKDILIDRAGYVINTRDFLLMLGSLTTALNETVIGVPLQDPPFIDSDFNFSLPTIDGWSWYMDEEGSCRLKVILNIDGSFSGVYRVYKDKNTNTNGLVPYTGNAMITLLRSKGYTLKPAMTATNGVGTVAVTHTPAENPLISTGVILSTISSIYGVITNIGIHNVKLANFTTVAGTITGTSNDLEVFSDLPDISGFSCRGLIEYTLEVVDLGMSSTYLFNDGVNLNYFSIIITDKYTGIKLKRTYIYNNTVLLKKIGMQDVKLVPNSLITHSGGRSYFHTAWERVIDDAAIGSKSVSVERGIIPFNSNIDHFINISQRGIWRSGGDTLVHGLPSSFIDSYLALDGISVVYVVQDFILELDTFIPESVEGYDNTLVQGTQKLRSVNGSLLYEREFKTFSRKIVNNNRWLDDPASSISDGYNTTSFNSVYFTNWKLVGDNYSFKYVRNIDNGYFNITKRDIYDGYNSVNIVGSVYDVGCNRGWSPTSSSFVTLSASRYKILRTKGVIISLVINIRTAIRLISTSAISNTVQFRVFKNSWSVLNDDLLATTPPPITSGVTIVEYPIYYDNVIIDNTTGVITKEWDFEMELETTGEDLVIPIDPRLRLTVTAALAADLVNLATLEANALAEVTPGAATAAYNAELDAQVMIIDITDTAITINAKVKD